MLGSAGASSLAPAGPEAWVGNWVLYLDGQYDQGCALQLAAAGRLQGGATGCPSQWLGQAVAGWASKPDGITLAGENRRTLIVLSPAGSARYRGRTRQGVMLWFEPRAPQP